MFGERLARRLAPWSGIELVLAARGREALERLAAELGSPFVVLDRDRPEGLSALAPFAAIDCAGPFQGQGYAFAKAALAAGAHYIDIADARDFVAGFSEAVDPEARRAGRLAVTGASSAPALSGAATEQLTEGWRRIDSVRISLSPGARAPVGKAMVQALLSWAGRTVRVFAEGGWRSAPGFSLLRRLEMPGLGWRWVALAETPDLDLVPARFRPSKEALFLAGHEIGAVQIGLWLLTLPVRLGFPQSLRPFAGPLRAMAAAVAPLGSDRGGLVVEAEGEDDAGRPASARWALWAEAGVGPNVPTLAAEAVLRALVAGRLAQTGAAPCVGLVSLEEILAPAAHLPIHTRLERRRGALWPDVLGEDFDRLPEPVRRVHAGLADETFRGRAIARGSRGPAAIVRRLQGLPAVGRYEDFSVRIAPGAQGEAWTRAFGGRAFSTRLRQVGTASFEERAGPVSFRLQAIARGEGFDWRLKGWRVGIVPLPLALAPRIRARSFARDGTYRFSVVIAHPLAGVIAGYAGRLSTA